MRQLVTSRFNCSVLNFLTVGSLREIRDIICGKVRVMPCVTLYANFPRLLCHSEYKRPAIFGVKVDICENKQALGFAQFDVCFQVIENLAGMELFNFRVVSDSCLN